MSIHKLISDVWNISVVKPVKYKNSLPYRWALVLLGGWAKLLYNVEETLINEIEIIPMVWPKWLHSCRFHKVIFV